MKTQHTEGPWEIVWGTCNNSPVPHMMICESAKLPKDRDHVDSIAIGADAMSALKQLESAIVAIVPSNMPESREANARLISFAPALFAALQECVASLDDHGENNSLGSTPQAKRHREIVCAMALSILDEITGDTIDKVQNKRRVNAGERSDF